MPTVLVPNAKHIFLAHPDGAPVPVTTTRTDASDTLDLEHAPLHGGFLLKTLALFIDPYMRGRMKRVNYSVRPRADVDAPYQPPFEIGKPISGFGVARVLRSEHAAVPAGALVYGVMQFAEYSIEPAPEPLMLRVLPDEPRIPVTYWLGGATAPRRSPPTPSSRSG